MAVIIDGTLGITSVNGSAAAPSVTGTDTDTGIVYGTNTLSLATGGTTAVTVDSSQNVGIGTAPSSWNLSGLSALQIKSASAYGYGSTELGLQQNAYYNSGWKYINTGVLASQYGQNNGVHTWSVAPSGTAGNSISWSEAMRIDSSGNVGIGTAPSYKFDVLGATSRFYFDSTSNTVTLDGNGTNRDLTFYARYANTATLQTDGYWIFKASNTERMRLDSNALTMAAIRLVFNGASGIPSPTNNGDGCVGTAASYGTCLIGKGSSYDIGFLNKNGNFAGYVATGATTITTSSDERLKENNQPITGALDIVCQMRHETGNYKSDPDRQVAFLIAQDVDALFPYAVEKTDPEQMGVNYNWIIPLHGAAITELTALVKEQQAIIEQLKADVAELKAAK